LALGLASVGLIALLVALATQTGQSLGWAYDFRAYFDAAERLLVTGTPYQAVTLDGPFRPGPGGLYLYSPILATLLTPLTALGFDGAALVWLCLRVGLLALTCVLLPVSRVIRLAVFGTAALSAPVLHDLNLGNVSLVVTFLAAAGWRWLDRPAGAAAVAASLFVRPQMAMVSIWQVLRRQWRPVLWTIGVAGLILLASLVFLGLERWLEYVTVLRNLSDVTGVERNVDLSSSAVALGLPEPLPSVLLFGGYLLAIGAILVSLRRDREIGYVVAVMATLLLSPLMWDHYLTNLILPAALLAARGRPWAVLLPLLGWLPLVLLPLAAVGGLLLPFLARSPDGAVGRPRIGGQEAQHVTDPQPGPSSAAGG